MHSKIKLLFHISNNKATTLIFTPSTCSHVCISHHVVCHCTGMSTCDVISQFSPLSTCVLFWFFVFPVSIRFFTCRHFTQFLSQPLHRSALRKEVLSEEKKMRAEFSWREDFHPYGRSALLVFSLISD